MNVGGLHVEMRSPSMKHASVGGSIVLGGWESQLQGKGARGLTFSGLLVADLPVKSGCCP